jgi:hypothetical protein
MIPIANAQNEFKSLFDSKYLRLAHVRKINGGDAWKVENGTYILIQQQRKQSREI